MPRGWKSHLLDLEVLETQWLWSQEVAEDQIGSPEEGGGQRIPLLVFVFLHFRQIKKKNSHYTAHRAVVRSVSSY